MLQQVLHEFEEVGLEPLGHTLKEIDVELRGGLIVTVVSTPLYDCACLKYKYVKKDDVESVSIIYWPASVNYDEVEEPIHNVWPLDRNYVVTILNLKLMLLMLKQMLP